MTCRAAVDRSDDEGSRQRGDAVRTSLAGTRSGGGAGSHRPRPDPNLLELALAFLLFYILWWGLGWLLAQVGRMLAP